MIFVRIQIGMRGGAKSDKSVKSFLHRRWRHFEKSNFHAEEKHVKPVHGLLFRPKAKLI